MKHSKEEAEIEESPHSHGALAQDLSECGTEMVPALCMLMLPFIETSDKV